MGSVEYARRRIEEFYESGSAVLGIWREEKACRERFVVCSGY